jgi:thiamine-phosphate pyrophosphorylase
VKASLTPEEIHEANHKGLIDKHVYALGGMSLENIQQAKDMGFGGVVICGDLWNRFSIQHEINFHELISHFRKLKKATN